MLPLASCANSGFGQALQDSLAADPKLKETAPDGTLPTITGEQASPQPQAQLPADFPGEIPRYPGATLQEVSGEQGEEAEVSTRWQTSDSSDRVLAFYREQLQTNGWQLAASPLIGPAGTLSAQRNDLTVTVTFEPTTPNANLTATNFTLAYTPETAQVGQAPATPSPSPFVNPSASPSVSSSPSPQELEGFLGAEGTSDGGEQARTEAIAALPPNTYTDLDKAPKELRQYVSDLAQLGVLNLSSSKEKSATTTFSPNKPVSRREYVRWLFEATNQLYADRAAQQIRPGNSAAQPAFRDVPRTDPDFAAIQGLAEAGIIPSALSGDPTAVKFRPDAQLSRETMVLWKVPIDTRQTLPSANLDTLKQTWGFQDTVRIDPKAQRAVLADYQNADLSNIRRVFGYTTLFQPKKPVTRAEAAASLWYFGYQGEGVSAGEVRQEK